MQNPKKSLKINIKIDGKTLSVAKGSTILQAARNAGIYIPTLCYLKNTSEYGGCRLCVVEIRNFRGYPTACTTPVAESMEIITKSPVLQMMRRNILELLLSEHPYTCLVCRDKGECAEYMHTTRKVSVTTGCNFCPANGSCELQDLAEYLELEEIDFPISYRNVPVDNENPFYKIDYNLCILCGRCVRACNEIRNSGVLSFVQRGNSALIGVAFGESQMEAGCEYCGACVDVCPTGSLIEKMGAWIGKPDRSDHTNCIFCSIACEMNINTQNNKIVNVGPEPGNKIDPLQLCVRGKFVPPYLAHNPERLTKPLIKKENRWIEVEWEEAIQFIVKNLEKYNGSRFGIIGSAHDTNENNYVLQKFARKFMKSNNVDLFDSLYDKNLILKIYNYYANSRKPEITRIPNYETILLLGANASESHPIIEKNIRTASVNNKKIIVASPFQNRSRNFANQIINYRQGKEPELLMLMISELLKNQSTNKAIELKELITELDTGKSYKDCNIKDTEIKRLSEYLKESQNVLIVAGNGILKHPLSNLNLNALFSLKELLKQPDKTDILFLLDEGNRMGATLTGMHPEYLPGLASINKKNNIKQWSETWNSELSEIPGIEANDMIDNIPNNGIKALYVIGNIPPKPKLSKLKFLLQQNMFLTETSDYAHVVLPMPFFMEIKGHIINIEGKQKEIRRIIDPPDNIREPWEVIMKLAEKLAIDGFNYSRASEITSEIKKTRAVEFINEKETPTEITDIKTLITDIKDRKNTKDIYKDIYHYQGNSLCDLIPDMKHIRDEIT